MSIIGSNTYCIVVNVDAFVSGFNAWIFAGIGQCYVGNIYYQHFFIIPGLDLDRYSLVIASVHRTDCIQSIIDRSIVTVCITYCYCCSIGDFFCIVFCKPDRQCYISTIHNEITCQSLLEISCIIHLYSINTITKLNIICSCKGIYIIFFYSLILITVSGKGEFCLSQILQCSPFGFNCYCVYRLLLESNVDRTSLGSL